MIYILMNDLKTDIKFSKPVIRYNNYVKHQFITRKFAVSCDI